MKRFLATLALIALVMSASAQQTIALDKSGESSVTTENGNLSINLAGMNFLFGGNQSKTTQSEKSQKSSKAEFGFGGFMPSYNHLALFEIGSNFVVNTDFSNCEPAVQEALRFSHRKAVQLAINLMTMNVPFNPKRTLGFTLGFGFNTENYTFANNVTIKYEHGDFNIVELDASVKKSKLAISYIHIPMLFDWNIRKGFFISAGASLDILMGGKLSYKKPKVVAKSEIPLNPLQVGVTARIGWRRLYAYVNYSPLNMYKSYSGINANRMSAGMGLWF